jgi:hypothetical protein
MTNIEAAKQLFVDGLDLIKNNEFEQAENKFLKSLQLNPDRESVLNNLSTAQIKLSKYKDVMFEIIFPGGTLEVFAPSQEIKEVWVLNIYMVRLNLKN